MTYIQGCHMKLLGNDTNFKSPKSCKRHNSIINTNASQQRLPVNHVVMVNQILQITEICH